MAKLDIKLLDCTLRDGGYVNDWKWGYDIARDIINYLIKSEVEIIEVGFLRNIEKYNSDITVCNTIEELNRLIPDTEENVMFSVMAMRSNFDISKLSSYSGHGIEMIRVTAHDYDIEKGLEFARQVKEKGYKVSINPINIMGYSDKKILEILEKVNRIQPYQFSIVDTFGSMKKSDLVRIVSIVDNNLNEGIRLALHLHENMSLGCLLAQNFVEMQINRSISIDGSLMGMGRNPGNLPIELIADYLNDNEGKNYQINYMLDAIDDYISSIKGKSEWGYNTAYFLSARYNLHRNYAEHYIKKGNLSSKDINQIFKRFDRSKATVFDKEYADKLYDEYLNKYVDDENAKKLLDNELKGKDILLLAPGASIIKYQEQIEQYIKEHNAITVAINFIPQNYKIDFAFFSNNRRWEKFEKTATKVIATSNLDKVKADYYINYNSLKLNLGKENNGLLLLLNLLHDLGINKVAIGGADGYISNKNNYYSESLRSYLDHDNSYNWEVANVIKDIGIKVNFLAPSKYEEYL